LNFAEPDGASPPTQKHSFFPSATMILEFPCPHGDCEGTFDLTSVAVELLSAGSAVTKGVTSCTGSRLGPQSGRHACVLSLQYHIAALYREPGRRGS